MSTLIEDEDFEISDEELLNSDNEEYIDEEDESDFIALLLEDVKRKIKRPSLDQILEKIKHDGIQSLSQFEKDTLEEYSKK